LAIEHRSGDRLLGSVARAGAATQSRAPSVEDLASAHPALKRASYGVGGDHDGGDRQTPVAGVRQAEGLRPLPSEGLEAVAPALVLLRNVLSGSGSSPRASPDTPGSSAAASGAGRSREGLRLGLDINAARPTSARVDPGSGSALQAPKRAADPMPSSRDARVADARGSAARPVGEASHVLREASRSAWEASAAPLASTPAPVLRVSRAGEAPRQTASGSAGELPWGASERVPTDGGATPEPFASRRGASAREPSLPAAAPRLPWMMTTEERSKPRARAIEPPAMLEDLPWSVPVVGRSDAPQADVARADSPLPLPQRAPHAAPTAMRNVVEAAESLRTFVTREIGEVKEAVARAVATRPHAPPPSPPTDDAVRSLMSRMRTMMQEERFRSGKIR
jgi:hypothetical protein